MVMKGAFDLKIKLENCVCGSNNTECFINLSYYDMFTIRCNNCQNEWDYLTVEMGVEFWNRIKRKARPALICNRKIK
jgi:hypothetical protein